MACLPERAGVVRDPMTGEMIIPASQRPDGSWRKARRVKDGYIPQEEMPAFQTRGNQFTKSKADHPIGLSQSDVQKVRKAKEAQVDANTNAAVRARSAKAKDKPAQIQTQTKENQAQKPKAKKKQKTVVESVTKKMSEVQLSDQPAVPVELTQEDIAKKIRNLRKKLRQIEDLETKISSGDIQEVNPERLDKISKKQSVLDEIEQLEAKLKV